MLIDKVSIGPNPPWEMNVIIEISSGSVPVKYEFDKASGALFVDRLLHTAMYYPSHYGFMPHTLAEDGDPVDALVVAEQTQVVPGCVMRSRPVGVLLMEDEAGEDEKIICVPTNDLHPFYCNVSSYHDLPQILLDKIAHFFSHYKDLEVGKWVKVKGWGEPQDAAERINAAIERARKEKLKSAL